MIKIEVQGTEVNVKSGTSARTGRPFTIREQTAYAHTFGRDGKPNPYPVKMTLTLENDQQPYQPGMYLLSPASLYTNRFGQLEVTPVLVPATQQLKAA